MKISKFNHEGYCDPTPYLAFLNIPDPAKEEERRRDRLARYRPLVYICSPYAGDVKANVLNARRYCRFAVQKDCILIPGERQVCAYRDGGRTIRRRLQCCVLSLDDVAALLQDTGAQDTPPVFIPQLTNRVEIQILSVESNNIDFYCCVSDVSALYYDQL